MSSVSARAAAFRRGRSAVVTAACQSTHRGRAELVYGKCHCTEYLAGVVVLCFHAFFFGNAVFNRIHKILCGALYTHYGKDAESYYKSVPVRIRKLSAVYRARNAVGYIAAGTAATAGAAALRFLGRYHLGGKDYGVYGLNYRDRQIGALFTACAVIGRAEAGAAGLALEHGNVALAAEKYNLFLNGGNSLDFLNVAGADAYLAYDTHIHFYRKLIKAAVKGNRIYIYIRPYYSCAFCTDSSSALHKLLTAAGQKDGNVFKAILVAAGIKYAVCIYTYHISCGHMTPVFSHIL